jgi:hypothetical protein
MSAIRQDFELDGVPLVRLESEFLRADVAPSVGGRIVSLFEKRSGQELLWRNSKRKLELLPNGAEYDPSFFGGIDELLPNDIPERINQIDCPDHGELWTTSLGPRVQGEKLLLNGTLSKFGLRYEREMSLLPNQPSLEIIYRISNPTNQPREFLWKLHAALTVEAGDVIDCPARKAQVVGPAWSRFKSAAPFPWPNIEGRAANVVPRQNGTVDFFYLFELMEGRLACHRKRRNITIGYTFDTNIFPYAWLFASYGGFNGYYTVILEPCTAMPLSVNEAAAKKQCSRLEPGQSLQTGVSLYVNISQPEGEERQL